MSLAIGIIIIKPHFYDKFMRIGQNGSLDKFMLCFSILCIVMYGAIEFYAVQIYATGAWLT